jgi:hypothetical protein
VAQQFDENEELEQIENRIEDDNTFSCRSEDREDNNGKNKNGKQNHNKKAGENRPISREGKDMTYYDICDFCTGKKTLAQSKTTLIWLHAYRYESGDWKFEAPKPDWADPEVDGRQEGKKEDA